VVDLSPCSVYFLCLVFKGEYHSLHDVGFQFEHLLHFKKYPQWWKFYVFSVM
jgi:hypothetical protein